MKRTLKTFLVLTIAFIMAIGPAVPAVYGTESADSDVQAVVEQLEAIDTLQQMQDKRNSYKVTKSHYDTGFFLLSFSQRAKA